MWLCIAANANKTLKCNTVLVSCCVLLIKGEVQQSILKINVIPL